MKFNILSGIILAWANATHTIIKHVNVWFKTSNTFLIVATYYGLIKVKVKQPYKTN